MSGPPAAPRPALTSPPSGPGAAGYARLLTAHARAARPLLTADGEAFVRRLVSAAGPDDPAPADPPVPRWDGAARRLWLGAVLLKTYRQPAPRQVTLLAAFEEEGWAAGHIDDPLPPRPGEGE